MVGRLAERGGKEVARPIFCRVRRCQVRSGDRALQQELSEDKFPPICGVNLFGAPAGESR